MKTLSIACSILFFCATFLSCAKEAKLNEGDVKEPVKKSATNSSAKNSIVEENDLCICAKDFRPVCGDDGVTYPNACEAECAGVKDFVEGSCEEESEEEL